MHASSARRAANAAGFSVLGWLLTAVVVAGCIGPERGSRIKDAELHFDLGVDAFHKNEPATALRELMKAQEFDPTNPRIPNTMGLIYLGREMFAEAQKSFEQALEIDPKMSDAWNNLGALFIQIGRWDKAIEACEKASTDVLYPYPYLPLGNIGWAYFKKDDLKQATYFLRKAVKERNDFCRGWEHLGQVYLAQGELGAAEKALRKAIEKCPGFQFQEAYFHLAVCLQRLGRQEEATAQLELCYKSAPESELGLKCQRMLGDSGG